MSFRNVLQESFTSGDHEKDTFRSKQINELPHEYNLFPQHVTEGKKKEFP